MRSLSRANDVRVNAHLGRGWRRDDTMRRASSNASSASRLCFQRRSVVPSGRRGVFSQRGPGYRRPSSSPGPPAPPFSSSQTPRGGRRSRSTPRTFAPSSPHSRAHSSSSPSGSGVLPSPAPSYPRAVVRHRTRRRLGRRAEDRPWKLAELHRLHVFRLVVSNVDKDVVERIDAGPAALAGHRLRGSGLELVEEKQVALGVIVQSGWRCFLSSSSFSSRNSS